MGCPADLPLSDEPDSFTSSWHLLGMALAVGRLALDWIDEPSASLPGHPVVARSAMRGIVFVVRSNSNGLHKIGVTKDWLRSSKQLQVGQQTTQIHTVWVNNALQIERYLQRRFRAKRMPQSDWFALDAGNLDFLRAVLLKARSDHQPPPPALPAQLSRPAPRHRPQRRSPPGHRGQRRRHALRPSEHRPQLQQLSQGGPNAPATPLGWLRW